MPTDAEVAPVKLPTLSLDERIRVTYGAKEDVLALVGQCSTLEQLKTLYQANEKIAAEPSMREQFQHRKLAIHYNAKP